MPIAVEFDHVSKYFVKSHRASSFRETVINLFSRQRGTRQAERQNFEFSLRGVLSEKEW